MKVDVCIIGAGVVGSAIARELSKFNLDVLVVEKNPDVAQGTSKANSGIVHGGHDAKPGSLKARLNVEGNAMFDELSEKLDFPFKRNGSLVLAFQKDDLPELEALLERGASNGVQGLKILTGDEVRALEPAISDGVFAALYVPSGGIVCPYEMTIALAENAAQNGVNFMFNQKVEKIEKTEDGFSLYGPFGTIEAKVLVNAAGLYSDEINNALSSEKIEIIPRRGQYCLLDKSVGPIVTKTVFQMPTKMGKGILVTPTADGNILLGPTAEDIEEKDDVCTTAQGLEEAQVKAKLSVKNLPGNKVITSFAGVRAHATKDDFIIGEAPDVKNLINVCGIESPGLTAAPAIGVMVAAMVKEKLNPKEKENFVAVRKAPPRFREMSHAERDAMIKKNPDYGKIICRCEMVTKGEILAALRSPLKPKDLDAIKRRTRTGMGRCQAGFCSMKMVDIMAEELKISPLEVTKFGNGSHLLVGLAKRD